MPNTQQKTSDVLLSIIVITLNEEASIESCLESVKWANEIIIVDSGSTDCTLDLARKYTEKYMLKRTGRGTVFRNNAHRIMQQVNGYYQ